MIPTSSIKISYAHFLAFCLCHRKRHQLVKDLLRSLFLRFRNLPQPRVLTDVSQKQQGIAARVPQDVTSHRHVAARLNGNLHDELPRVLFGSEVQILVQLLIRQILRRSSRDDPIEVAIDQLTGENRVILLSSLFTI
jgi:hypothetical protein